MTITQWIIFFVVMNIVHGAATWKFYKKAGVDAWKAFVPFLNIYELMGIIAYPKWWMIFVYIPIVNLLMIPTLWVQILASFGKETGKDKALAIFTLGAYVAYVNYTEADQLTYDTTSKSAKETLLGSLVFAIIAATIVHTYFFQPFTIPSPSLEKSLLVGDYLIVSKMHYGARPPITTIATPMVHDTIPVINKRSYSKFPQLPYLRFPGFQKIKNNDIVVFNWPADTVVQFFKAPDYAQYKPIDKKSHYVKRCVAIAGDSLQIKNGIIYVNGKEVVYPDRTDLQHYYKITTKDSMPFSARTLNQFNNMGILKDLNKNHTEIILNLTNDRLEIAKKYSNVASIKLLDRAQGLMYGNKNWTLNNFGPIYIPKKGDVLQLNKETYPFYKWIIQRYDGHDAEHKLNKHEVTLKGDDVYIDGKLTKEYTVQQDYYWMMGDNRSESEDSRYWGYVPFDHVVGKPVFIFFSKGENGIRWNRLFTTVSGEGKRVSYLIPFIVLLLFYFGYTEYKKKKNKNS